MIKDPKIAKKISDVLLNVSGLLSESVGVMVDSDCTDEEKDFYVQTVGKVMGIIGLDVLNNLYEEHPSLLPEGYYLPKVRP